MEKCDICEMPFKTSKTLKVHKAKGNCKNLLKCQACGNLFKTKLSLKNHRCSSLDNQCDVCSKYYKNKKQLKCHQVIHEESKIFTCNPCGKKFTTVLSFNNHQQSSCDALKESLACSTDLQINMKEHNFICECGKTFKGKEHLAVHKHMLHAEEKEKSFPCPECGESFIHPTYMKTHFNNSHMKVIKKMIKIHKDEQVKCPICRRIFKRASSMKLHMAKLLCNKKQSSIDRRHDKNSNSEVDFTKCSQAKDKMEGNTTTLETSTWSMKQVEDLVKVVKVEDLEGMDVTVANFLADFVPIKVERVDAEEGSSLLVD